MRYLVKAKLKPGREGPLLEAIDSGTLGHGSVAGDEYLEDMAKARVGADGICTWVEVCFCANPLEEERPYWEQYFELLHIKDAHARKNCRDANGTEPWACCDCECTKKLEEQLKLVGDNFLNSLKARSRAAELTAEESNSDATNATAVNQPCASGMVTKGT
jgi:hypothetical protein